MATHRIVSVRRVSEPPDATLKLVAGADDQPYVEDDRQSELRVVFDAIREGDPAARPRMRIQRTDSGAASLTGEFLVHVAALTSPVFAALGVWFAARAGRRIRLKVGDVEVEAATLEQIEQLLVRVHEIKREQDGVGKP